MPMGQLDELQKDGKTYLYQYDKNGHVTQISEDEKQLAKYSYNEAGQPLTINENDQTTNYAYNAHGDVISLTTPEKTQTFGYDNNGLLTSLTESEQTARFEYSPLGKLNKITFPNGASHSYDFNPLGFRKSTTRSDGSSMLYNYDVTGNFTGADQQTASGETHNQRIHPRQRQQGQSHLKRRPPNLDGGLQQRQP